MRVQMYAAGKPPRGECGASGPRANAALRAGKWTSSKVMLKMYANKSDVTV